MVNRDYDQGPPARKNFGQDVTPAEGVVAQVIIPAQGTSGGFAPGNPEGLDTVTNEGRSHGRGMGMGALA